jgi:hypothetical protein
VSNLGQRWAKFTHPLRVRISPVTFAALEQQSAATGRRVSDVAREAIESYVAQAASQESEPRTREAVVLSGGAS